MKIILRNGDMFTVISLWFEGNDVVFELANRKIDRIDRQAILKVES